MWEGFRARFRSSSRLPLGLNNPRGSGEFREDKRVEYSIRFYQRNLTL